MDLFPHPTVLRQDYQFLDWQKAWLRALALEVTQALRDESNKGGVTWRGGGRTDDYKGNSILSLLDT